MNRHAASVLFLPFLALPLLAQDKLGPTLQTKKGDAAAFVVDAVQQQAIDMAGQQVDAGHSMKHEIAVKVTEIDAGGNLTVEVHMKRIHGTFEMPMMGSLAFDTATKADENKADDEDAGMFGMPSGAMLRKVMLALTEKPLIARLSPAGKVTAVEGLDEATKKAQKAAGPMAAGMLAGAINEGSIRAIIGGLFGQLPPEATAVGGSWEQSETEQGRTPMKRATKVTLVKADAKSYELGITGTMSSPSDEDLEKMAEEQGDGENAEMIREMMRTMKMKNGKIEGKSTVDRATGLVLSSESKMTVDITMESPMGGDMSIGITNSVKVARQPAEAGKADSKKAASDGR